MLNIRMYKKLSYLLVFILVSGTLIWEYKVNILVWAIPKISNISVQDNIPTSWSIGPEMPTEDDRPKYYINIS